MDMIQLANIVAAQQEKQAMEHLIHSLQGGGSMWLGTFRAKSITIETSYPNIRFFSWIFNSNLF